MYQLLAGKQIYLTITRPNISYVVSLVSQFMHDPRTDHLAVVHRILRYLKGPQVMVSYLDHMDMERLLHTLMLIGLDP